jgi:hypothetical protein
LRSQSFKDCCSRIRAGLPLSPLADGSVARLGRSAWKCCALRDSLRAEAFLDTSRNYTGGNHEANEEEASEEEASEEASAASLRRLRVT